MMGEEVVLVAVYASKGITDYALDWAVCNVIKKTMDSDSLVLVLLAVLPSRQRPPLASGNQIHQSYIYHFLSRLLKKRGVGQNDQGSVEGHDVPQRIHHVCEQMMQQLFLVHNVDDEVTTEVKVVVDAQMGSVAKAAQELGATWVILDRRLKKEGDICLKELLSCNIILIDHAIPKILRSIQFPTNKKINNFEKTSLDPTVADMLGVLPTHCPNTKSGTTQSRPTSDNPHSKPDNSFFLTQTHHIKSGTTQSRSTSDSPHSKPGNSLFSTQTHHIKSGITQSRPTSDSPHSKHDNSFFSTQTRQDHFINNTTPSFTKSKLAGTSPSSNSRFFSHELEYKTMYSYTPPQAKSQPLYNMLKSDIEPPRKLTSSATKERSRDFSSQLKPRTDRNRNKRDDEVVTSNSQILFEINERTKNFSSPLKAKSGKIETDMNKTSSVEVRKTASIPARRSTDSLHFSDLKQRITRRELASSSEDEVVTHSSSPTSCIINGRTKNFSCPLKTQSEMNINSRVEVTKTASIPARRSTDSSFLRQKPMHSNGSRQRSIKREFIGSDDEVVTYSSSPTIDRTSSIRKAMSLSIKQPPTPPPLCSICKHNAPNFGKAPKRFSYREIEKATDGFEVENLVAEGGYGPVYRGVLSDGQLVAVKQHKMVSAQGASEFCSEVEVLSCAQHRNLVMLVGYCIEIEWLLVYEFACNGSLDKHLYGRETKEVMAWHNRMKVAIGAARGLRYLHEDCRVGCIVHRDFRPNNILLTHDFEPMVGDFGLARWQADGQSAEETRVIGSFGYLSPEYTQTGLITEKADVYSFGIVLLELLTGIKATEFSKKGIQLYQPEWGRQLLEKKMPNQIIDPRLENNYVQNEVECMIHAASICILPDPEQRPRMSKVLRILEGDSAASYLVNPNGQPNTSLYDPKQD